MSAFAFLSNNTFLKAPVATAAMRYAIAGIAWDGAVTNRPGARFGPRAIRDASHMLCEATHPHFDVSPPAISICPTPASRRCARPCCRSRKR
jgi:agmatinase